MRKRVKKKISAKTQIIKYNSEYKYIRLTIQAFALKAKESIITSRLLANIFCSLSVLTAGALKLLARCYRITIGLYEIYFYSIFFLPDVLEIFFFFLNRSVDGLFVVFTNES